MACTSKAFDLQMQNLLRVWEEECDEIYAISKSYFFMNKNALGTVTISSQSRQQAE
jgi:hypothetical protein